MKRYLLLIIFLVSISCGFHKEIKSSKRYVYYKELDSLEVLSKYENFTIKIPNEWYSYQDIHGIIFHSPKILKKSNEVNLTNNFSVLNSKLMGFDESNSSNLFSFIIEKRKKQYKDFSYNSQEYKHVKYGLCKVVKYVYFSGNQKKAKIEFLIDENSSCYNLIYESNAEYFDTFLPDFLKIVDSFEIM